VSCRAEEYQTQIVPIGGVDVRVLTDPADQPQAAAVLAIFRTLELLPRRHLDLLRSGHVQISKRQCPPRRGGGNDPEVPWVRVSRAAADETRNHQYCITMLHELGHIVDTRYGAMAWLRDNDPEGYRFLAATAHEGATDFDGERFADCYMLYLLNEVARRPTRHPAEPAAYQGEAAQRRYRILLSTPAFRTE
jgi:hypothetical protein